MEKKLPSFFTLAPEVARGLSMNMPLVALESTVITHGLPYPANLSLAQDMENEVRREGAVPATIAVVDGKVQVGLSLAQLESLADASRGKVMKISTRDFAKALVLLGTGGTTVAGTMQAANTAGIKVFATGGIGGVHHDISGVWKGSFDISTDLPSLARIPMIVVCAGAKAILDLPATLEYLETWGIPVVGYQTDDFPAFYSRSSGLKASARANTPEEVVMLARYHWEMGNISAVLVTVPPPEGAAIPYDQVAGFVRQALREAQEQKIRGQGVTPFLLQRMGELSDGATVTANLELLLNNARVAAQIARMWIRTEKPAPAA